MEADETPAVVPPSAPPAPRIGKVWTKAMLLEAAGFKPVEDVRRVVRRTRRIVARGKDQVAIEAAKLTLEMADIRRPSDERDGGERPVGIQINLVGGGADAGVIADLDRVGIRVLGHEGESPGGGGVWAPGGREDVGGADRDGDAREGAPE